MKVIHTSGMQDLRSFTPTLCQLMDVPKPKFADQVAFAELIEASPNKKTKALIYCPDAFGLHALKRYPHLHQKIKSLSTHEISLRSMMPSVTPVCFASLFSGLAPAQHGIESYRKPVLTCQTVFDAFIAAGKKVALVAVKECSVDIIFRNRKMDYFSLDHDSLVTVKALELLEKDEHDLIIVYHQEYDDLLHASGPFSQVAEWALNNHTQTYELLVNAVKNKWKENYVIAFTPDHGAHVNPTTGLGDHGEDRDEDMSLRHFFVLK